MSKLWEPLESKGHVETSSYFLDEFGNYSKEFVFVYPIFHEDEEPLYNQTDHEISYSPRDMEETTLHFGHSQDISNSKFTGIGKLLKRIKMILLLMNLYYLYLIK